MNTSARWAWIVAIVAATGTALVLAFVLSFGTIRSWTAVATLLTFCPPGPVAVMKLSLSVASARAATSGGRSAIGWCGGHVPWHYRGELRFGKTQRQKIRWHG